MDSDGDCLMDLEKQLAKVDPNKRMILCSFCNKHCKAHWAYGHQNFYDEWIHWHDLCRVCDRNLWRDFRKLEPRPRPIWGPTSRPFVEYDEQYVQYAKYVHHLVCKSSAQSSTR